MARAGRRRDHATAIGFCGGDDWEPEIAAAPDGLHVYVVWAHFPGDPTCDPASGNPNRIYIQGLERRGSDLRRGARRRRDDRRRDVPEQVDCVVTVDPMTGAVYVSFLAYGTPHDPGVVAVAKSTDFGAHFTPSR